MRGSSALLDQKLVWFDIAAVVQNPGGIRAHLQVARVDSALQNAQVSLVVGLVGAVGLGSRQNRGTVDSDTEGSALRVSIDVLV